MHQIIKEKIRRRIMKLCMSVVRRVMGSSGRRGFHQSVRLLSSGEGVRSSRSHTNGSGSGNIAATTSSTPASSSTTPTPQKDDENGIPASTYKAVAVLTGSQFISNCGFGCVIPVLPLFAAEMGLGASGVGLILSTTAVRKRNEYPAG